MASLGIHSSEKLSFPCFSRNKSNHFFSPNPILPILNKTKKIPQNRVSASITSSNSPLVLDDSHTKNINFSENVDSRTKDVNFAEIIDSWMQDSVPDIVKNLKKAPLLVSIYSENKTDKPKIQMEKAVSEKWPFVQNEWRNGESRSPDGLIFVEELEQDCDDRENVDRDFGEGVTRAWGIVVQGKGVECGPSCYLLKTDRVCAGMGLGFCTHFCLMRVNNFRDSALEQFKDSWLLQ